MPLYFEEVDDKKKEKEKKKAKEKAKPLPPEHLRGGPSLLQLDTQVLPQLIRKVGDWKSGRISQPMLEAYLDKHTLIFDRELLTKMFTEADYQKAGSLDARSLSIAITGRFPKREHTEDWRKLTALLMGLPELTLAEDPEQVVRYVQARQANGTFKSGCVWDAQPPALPPVGRRRSASTSARSRSTGSAPSPEWQANNASIAAALGASGVLGATGGSARGGAGPDPFPQRSAGSFDGPCSSYSSFCVSNTPSIIANAAPEIVRTTGGIKQLGQIGAELRVNGALGAAAGPGSGGAGGGLGGSGALGYGADGGGGSLHSTFGAQKEFEEFARGLEMLPRLAADSGGAGAGLGPGSTALLGATAEASGLSGSMGRTATFLGSPKQSVRAWGATLPPTAISLSPGALSTLRSSVRSTAASKADFVTRHRPLGSCEADLKKTMGKEMDVQLSLARVEPVRGTKILNSADYVEWVDYGANCRTSPGRWDHGHPAAVAQDSGDHKYPWC